MGAGRPDKNTPVAQATSLVIRRDHLGERCDRGALAAPSPWSCAGWVTVEVYASGDYVQTRWALGPRSHLPGRLPCHERPEPFPFTRAYVRHGRDTNTGVPQARSGSHEANATAGAASLRTESRSAARPGLDQNRQRQPQRGGTAGRHVGHAAQRQKGLASRVAAPGHQLHRPHDALRRRHARTGTPALRQGPPARSPGHPRGLGRRGAWPHDRRRLRVPRHGGARRGGAEGIDDPGRSGLDGLSGGPEPLRAAAGRDQGIGRGGRPRDRHRHHARPRAPGRLAGALRRGTRLPGRLRRRPHQDHPRHR